MKNANAKRFDRDRKQSSSSQFKTKTKERSMLGMAVSTLFPQDQSALGVKALVI